MHAPAEPHSRIWRAADVGGAPAFSDSGVDAVGFPRAVRARALAPVAPAPTCAAGSTRSASSMRWPRSRRPAATTRGGAMPERRRRRRCSTAEALGHPLIPRRPPRRQRRAGRAARHAAARHRLEHVRQEHAAARHRPEHRARAGRGRRCAPRRLRLPPCDLQTSIRVQDSLELGLSYFMAALARLKGVVDAAERPRGRAACCCTCSTRFSRAPTAPSEASRSAPSPVTCSTPVRSA